MTAAERVEHARLLPSLHLTRSTGRLATVQHSLPPVPCATTAYIPFASSTVLDFDLFETLSITNNAAVMPWIYTAKPSTYIGV